MEQMDIICKIKRMSYNIRLKMSRKRSYVRFGLLIVVIFAISFTISTVLFGDILPSSVLNLSDLHKCPICYGVSMCPALYSGRIILDKTPSLSTIFNQKNVYHGFTNINRRVVLKKLAHNTEFRELDDNLCDKWGLHNNCKPEDILQYSTEKDIMDKIIETVKPLDLTTISRSEGYIKQGMVMCPHPGSIKDLINAHLKTGTDKKTDLLNIWTMVNINAEPIILQVLSKTQGWAVPSYGGVCGRLELLAYEGEPLSNLLNEPWKRKLTFAKSILKAALDFTFKHERYRFYLVDWSLDNIVINEKDEAVIVDLEDIIILDKNNPPIPLLTWYDTYNETRDITDTSFSYSTNNICSHHLSDHNFWAACHILAEIDRPLLYPLPDDVKSSMFDNVVKECLYGDQRLKSVKQLLFFIDKFLLGEIVDFNVIR